MERQRFLGELQGFFAHFFGVFFNSRLKSFFEISGLGYFFAATKIASICCRLESLASRTMAFFGFSRSRN